MEFIINTKPFIKYVTLAADIALRNTIKDCQCEGMIYIETVSAQFEYQVKYVIGRLVPNSGLFILVPEHQLCVSAGNSDAISESRSTGS